MLFEFNKPKRIFDMLGEGRALTTGTDITVNKKLQKGYH